MLSAAALTRLRAGTRDAVADAVRLVPGVEAPVVQGRAVHGTGPAAFFVAGPHAVGVQRTRAHLVDAAHERRIRAAAQDQGIDVNREVAAYRDAMALTTVADMESAVDVRRARRGRPANRSTGKITAWSRKSKNRMENTLSVLDWTPMFEDGLAPVFVTLTLPDHWEQVAPTPEAFKTMVNRLKQYFRRAWGVSMMGVWKMEFQRPRPDHPASGGAPHLHMLIVPPQGVAASHHRYEFKQWLSWTWADIVNDPDSEEKRKHIRAGTNVRMVEVEYQGPHKIGTYFAKHATFNEKAYQNEMPRLWVDAIANGEAGAQFWGAWQLEKALAAQQLDAVAAAPERQKEALSASGRFGRFHADL